MLYQKVKDRMEINQAITTKELYVKLSEIWSDTMKPNKIRNNMYGALKTLQNKHVITKLGDGLYIRDY